MNDKKIHFYDKVSILIIILNMISVICFLLPPGRANYLNDILLRIINNINYYATFGMWISGILGVILNIISLINKKKLNKKTRINKIFIALFGLTIPFGWLLFNFAMSV